MKHRCKNTKITVTGMAATKKILYQAARPVMVELAGLKAFYGRFLDKNGVCW